MIRSKGSAFSVIQMFLWIFPVSRGDTEMTCVFMQSCVLPCSFQSSGERIIHWNQLTVRTVHVYSFYSNKEQLKLQDQRFRGRTSLFQDQISGGNASLLLRGVKVQDQGRYECLSTKSHSFIHLTVEAPVTKVNIKRVENRIICSSEGVYPAPEITWSIKLLFSTALENTITVLQTEEQLYSVSSCLEVSAAGSDPIYSCTVRTGRNKRKVTLFRPVFLSVSGTEATIPCSASKLTATSLVWRFNHNRILLSRTRMDAELRVSEEWRKHVKDVSESGSLTLLDLSSEEEGVYTCEGGGEEETMITDVFLRIERNRALGLVVGAVLLAGTVVALVVKSCMKWKK